MATRGRGRPTKLTPELAGKVYKMLLIGLTLDEAAAAAGVSSMSLKRWKTRGETATSGIYADFCALVKRARPEAQLNWLATIEKISRGEKATRTIRRTFKDGSVEERTEEYYLLQPQWVAAAWKLERYNPARWGRQVPLVQVNQQSNTVVQHMQQLQSMSGEELEARRKELLESNTKLIEGKVDDGADDGTGD